ncbi:hypothetical protein DTO271G3_2810 [Paecilomyces variotii]|nr:hypothetical protein DTO271G3_2810 [Paecilomyces variotii]
MLRTTAVKATGSLRNGACFACRRAMSIAASPKINAPAGARSNLHLTARRPLAVIDRMNNGRRQYAVSAEDTDKGVDPNDSFLQGNTANYIDEMYLAWKKDPESVHVSWRTYFKNMESGKMPISQAFQPPPTLIPPPAGGVPSVMPGAGLGADNDLTEHLKVQLLVRAYQARGHHKAKIDPLGIRGDSEAFGYNDPKELHLDHYGFTEADLDKEFTLGPGILPRFATESRKKMTLREIIDACEKIYCGSYGVEYIHIPDRKPCDWIRDRFEVPQPYKYSVDEKRRILDRLIWSSSFESFLATKFPNDKRFGLEGCESLVPGMKALIDRSVDYGIKDVVIGMPHRGRLNVLSNVVRKPNESIFSEFTGSGDPSDEGSGDVKYHLGMNFERPTPSGKRVQLSLVANPSHLEAEDPVVLGKARAIQHYNNDEQEFNTAMGVLLHGDAAFAAQGVVYETLGFHSLPAYSTGGTVHIIVNNQIGFTTDPRFARSTPYCSDIAKAIDAPVFHVNGDDVEARDVVVDIPLMYKRISSQKSQLDKYVEKLIAEGSFTKEDIEEHKNREWLTSAWNGFKTPKELATEILPHLPTGVDADLLKSIADKISGAPEGFNLHRNLKRILSNRKKTVEEGHHRHAVLHDQESEATYTPLQHITPDQGSFVISNSSLSEFGALGFEYGYSLTSPNALVMWEAQFGDFANNAQCIIDQFIASGEAKWLQRSGLVVSLPHGYDGQGPEHSSGRMERWLQLCNEEPRVFPSEEKLQRQHQDCNMQIAYMTSPSNLFHIMRRQINRQFRKPLVIFFSKSLLRHPIARSPLEEFTGDSHFQWIIPDPAHGTAIDEPEKIERVILCSGQVYAALTKHRESQGIRNTAITRIEQLHPFPWAQLKENLDSYPNAKNIVWCQEEPLNAGAWSYTQPRLETLLNATEHHNRRHVLYAGRAPSASVATGNKASHLKEEAELLEDAFSVHQEHLKGE